MITKSQFEETFKRQTIRETDYAVSWDDAYAYISRRRMEMNIPDSWCWICHQEICVCTEEVTQSAMR